MPGRPTDHQQIDPPVLYFGTPVSLISTCNSDGSANLAPISSSWYLGRTVVLGIASTSQTLTNLLRERECVINLPTADQHVAVERLAPLTGRTPVPDHKRDRFRHEPDKFAAAGLTEIPSSVVRPPRAAECPVHLEAVLETSHDAREAPFVIAETRVVRVHARPELVLPGTDHIDTDAWRPLLYVFRHYFGTGARLGRNFRADT